MTQKKAATGCYSQHHEDNFCTRIRELRSLGTPVSQACGLLTKQVCQCTRCFQLQAPGVCDVAGLHQYCPT